jgi:hypothetical protein
VLVTDLCLSEWIDCHAQSIARSLKLRLARCRIPYG